MITVNDELTKIDFGDDNFRNFMNETLDTFEGYDIHFNSDGLRFEDNKLVLGLEMAIEATNESQVEELRELESMITFVKD